MEIIECALSSRKVDPPITTFLIFVANALTFQNHNPTPDNFFKKYTLYNTKTLVQYTVILHNSYTLFLANLASS